MKGSIPMAGMFFLGIVAVVSLCIYFMCRARATRWQAKVGIPAQIVLGLVIVATFFFIGKPFSSYVTMMGQRKQVAAEIALVVGAAKNLNSEYNAYAEKRIAAYHPNEKTDARKAIRMAALQRQLLPSQLAGKQAHRAEWLDEISGMSISNIQMPNNLINIDSCVTIWTNDYIAMSSVIFSDEVDVVPFAYDGFATHYQEFKSKNVSYSIWALVVAVLCSIFMLIPYFTTTPDVSLSEGINESFSDKIKRKFVSSDSADSQNQSQAELDYM
ncbi:MAG: hypothetical protein IJ920_10215 [Paludibacteraceae bacterium]|nr:hypothetical protein [Paludibacteraceae bacterium]